MILIQCDTIKEIEKLHHNATYPHVSAMLELYITLLDALGNKKTQEKDAQGKIKSIHNDVLHHSTIVAAVKPFFESKVSDQITIEILEGIITTGHSSLTVVVDKTESNRLINLFERLKEKTTDILIGQPVILQDIIDNNLFHFPKKSIELECIGWIFDYEKLRKGGYKLNDNNKWDAYALTGALKISVCPYCNRNWIVTVTEEREQGEVKKVVNPQIDHFYSQDLQPHFAISLYNLIPSCEACNSRLKGSIQFNIKDYLHPYTGAYENSSRFNTIAKDAESAFGKENNYMIELIHVEGKDAAQTSRIGKNHETFQIKNIYEQHGDIVADIYHKKHLYSLDYIDSLQRMLSNSNHKLEPEEIYRLVFNNYYSEKDFNKRPFSKIVRDVIDNFGLFE